jgi:hypothetical protein
MRHHFSGYNATMLHSIKRLFARTPNAGDTQTPDRDLGQIFEWARRRGHQCKRAVGDVGFVIDSTLEGVPCRMEWGPSQRPYITGHELRMRMELGLPPEMQMLLLSRPLMDTLERQTFEEFTDNVQTQIGTQTPEEMRWLVMFGKVNMSTLKNIRQRFGAVANLPETGLSWLEGPLANALEATATDLLQDEPPFVLMTLRGRAYLRMQLVAPETKHVADVLALFETAVAQAVRAAGDMAAKLASLEIVNSISADSSYTAPQSLLPTSPTTDWQGFTPSAILDDPNDR